MSRTDAIHRMGQVTRREIPHRTDDSWTSEHEGFVELDGRTMYRVPHVQRMAPFLMTLSSESDLWMFVSSTGGLTAGRVEPSHSLFPYETEDRLHRLYGVTGPITLLRTTGERALGDEGSKAATIWAPFSPESFDPQLERHLYRDPLGARVVFEERNRNLGLTLRYQWVATDAYGFVRTAQLRNVGTSDVEVELLDGLLSLMPAGVSSVQQQTFSCLVDAYRQAEIERGEHLAVYSLTSPINDRPEPGEVLRATAVWSYGLSPQSISLDESAVGVFRRGETPDESLATRTFGRRGAYLIRTRAVLPPGETLRWHIVADVQQSHAQVERTRKLITYAEAIESSIESAIRATETGLRRNIAACDGLQASRDTIATAHHGLNVLLNNMRGGIPLRHYEVGTSEFLAFLASRNKTLATEWQDRVSSWPERATCATLLRLAGDDAPADLVRLILEYVPLTFGRRHGDPSRPWNQFSINLRNPDGSRRVGYQGNWRDIFQNWESMALSYPRLAPQFIAKFLNASTLDGFNPYRVTSEGIDWEIENPDEPWSHLGYWGDHQIVYLLRLLELCHDHDPAWLTQWLHRRVFSYANVPYRIGSYEDICNNPRSTIRFDHDRQKRIEARLPQVGADARLVSDPDGRVVHVTLLEKLLVPILSKVCNVVPGGGVWLNTQRPEWNDANNALAGWGLSVVTLGYMRRYLSFLERLIESATSDPAPRISVEVLRWADAIESVFGHHAIADPAFHASARDRRRFMDELGRAFEAYRTAVYDNGLSGETLSLNPARRDRLVTLLRHCRELVSAALIHNRRSDSSRLYHSYNLLSLGSRAEAEVGHLPEMLEGQVSLLSSGLIDGHAALHMIEALYRSALYRADAGSFILYPNRTVPAFLARNQVPPRLVEGNRLLRKHIDAGDASLLQVDAAGTYRFAPGLVAARHVVQVLDRLEADPRWSDDVRSCRDAVLAAYEDVFQHARFTGRSGGMHAYEGLGSIYWHMVGKLLVAVQECFWREVDAGSPATQCDSLARAYYRVRDGLGFNRRSAEFGAVPIEPYSHTPLGGGARQPGMTGQVKEEIITRRGELGVRVARGRVTFTPRLLRQRELLDRPAAFEWFSADEQEHSLPLEPGSVAFTLCQVPVVYKFGSPATSVLVHLSDGSSKRLLSTTLDTALSSAVFDRTGEVTRLEVLFPLETLTIE